MQLRLVLGPLSLKIPNLCHIESINVQAYLISTKCFLRYAIWLVALRIEAILASNLLKKKDAIWVPIFINLNVINFSNIMAHGEDELIVPLKSLTSWCNQTS